MPTSPEVYLLSSIVTKRDMKVALAAGVIADMFHTYREEWEWCVSYFQRYRRSPGRLEFRQRFPKFRLQRPEEDADTQYFADEVKRAHVRHELLDVMNEMAGLISDGELDQAVKLASSTIVSIASHIGNQNDSDIFTDYSDVLADVESRARRAKEHGSAGIPTGFPSFDEATGGLHPGNVIIIAGRLGHSKSWQLQRIAAHAAAAGYDVIFNALEQTRSEVTMRIHTLLSKTVGKEVFNSMALMRGKDIDLKAYKQFLRKLKEEIPGRLHVTDATQGRISPLSIAAQIERHQPDIVFIDYLTLMQKSGPDWQGIAQLSNDIKSIATKYQIPIVCAAQLNREYGLSRDPGAEALAGSDAIGQDADVVAFIRQMSRSVVRYSLQKNRNGVGGVKWWVEFKPSEGIIHEVGGTRAQELMDADADEDDTKEA